MITLSRNARRKDVDYDTIVKICKNTHCILRDFIYENHEYPFSYQDLAGACASASMVLYNIFTRMGVECTFVEKETVSGSHCWVELSDNLVVDITASQFGARDVYIARRPPTTYLGKGRHHRLGDIDIDELYDTLRIMDWSSECLIPSQVVEELTARAMR